MKLISAKNTIAIFYYLMSADGFIAEEELQKLDSIGVEVDAENYMSYRDDIIERCENQKLTVIDDEDYYDVISEGIDKELYSDIDDDEQVIASRLLIWNLLVIAYSDNEYHQNERRLIKHIVRVSGMPTSVFLEMELLIKSAIEVENERKWLSASNRPYNEIAPIVEELDRRIAYLSESAKNLIDDEVRTPSVEALEIKPTVFDHVENAVAPVAAQVKEAVEPVASGISKAVAPVGEKAGEAFEGAKTAVSGFASDVGKSIGGFFGGFGKKK
jgi:uncharacterized tellurite resistance protein B-like protein